MDNQKVLIAYATVSGSTEDIAQEMAKVVRSQGISVDISPASKVGSLETYDTVILGTPIYMGQPRKEIKELVDREAAVLKTKRVHTFAVSGTIKDGKPETRAMIEGALAPLNEIAGAVSSEVFAGRIRYKSVSLIFRTIAKAMKAEEGDWRDWDAIRAWAGGIAMSQSVAA